MAEEEEESAKSPNFLHLHQEEVSKSPSFFPIHPCPSPFLEINCNSSGKVRRFSVGTEAGFALQCINQKLDPGVPSASYIEAVKEGEEPITFGPSSVLIDYGYGWKLQTVTNEGFDDQDGLVDQFKDFPDVTAHSYQFCDTNRIAVRHVEKNRICGEPIRDDVQSATDVDFHLQDPLLEENRSVTISEPVSDIESQSLESLDFTDTFTTDEVFGSRDELIKWTREVGRAVGMVVIIKKSEFGVSGRSSRIYFACERFGKRREYKRASTSNTSTRKRVSKRCGCPFLLRGIKLPNDDEWRIKVECGHHNHPLGRHFQGSSVAGKLTPEEKEFVKQMLGAGFKAREILKALKERDHRNQSTIRTIYNAQAKWRLEVSANSQCNSSNEVECTGMSLDMGVSDVKAESFMGISSDVNISSQEYVN